MDQGVESLKSLLGDRIKQRSEHLALNAEQRRAEKGINASETENADFFYDSFQTMKENTEYKLQEAVCVDKEGIVQFLDSIVNDISNMQNFLNESSMFLPSFQIKKAQEAINIFNESIHSSILQLQPKKKFGFKNNKKEKVSGSTVASDVLDFKRECFAKEIKERAFFGFKDAINETLTMSSDNLKDRQFHLLNLTSCRVLALGNPSSLQFSNLKKSTVIVGPTSRSAFVKNCSNCQFVLACQQVRIHDCEDTTFYLHVTGAAIIENCRNISFGPYTLEYSEKAIHFEESGLRKEVNKWDKVEDFYWLNEREKSPNFRILEESEFKTNWL